MLIERCQILHLQIDRENETTIWMILLAEESHYFVRQELIHLLEDDAEVWNAVCPM